MRRRVCLVDYQVQYHCGIYLWGGEIFFIAWHNSCLLAWLCEGSLFLFSRLLPERMLFNLKKNYCHIILIYY